MDERDFRDTGGRLVTPGGRREAGGVRVRAAPAPATASASIVFGDSPYPQAPFTMDHALVQSMIGEALPGMAGPRTAFGDAIGLGIKMFDEQQRRSRR